MPTPTPPPSSTATSTSGRTVSCTPRSARRSRCTRRRSTSSRPPTTSGVDVVVMTPANVYPDNGYVLGAAGTAPTRLRAAVGMNPRWPDAVDQLRTHAAAGAVGVRITPGSLPIETPDDMAALGGAGGCGDRPRPRDPVDRGASAHGRHRPRRRRAPRRGPGPRPPRPPAGRAEPRRPLADPRPCPDPEPPRQAVGDVRAQPRRLPVPRHLAVGRRRARRLRAGPDHLGLGLAARRRARDLPPAARPRRRTAVPRRRGSDGHALNDARPPLASRRCADASAGGPTAQRRRPDRQLRRRRTSTSSRGSPRPPQRDSPTDWDVRFVVSHLAAKDRRLRTDPGDPYLEYAANFPDLFHFVVPDAVQPEIDPARVEPHVALAAAEAGDPSAAGARRRRSSGASRRSCRSRLLARLPHWRGPRVDHPRRSRNPVFAPCFHQPEVQRCYREALPALVRALARHRHVLLVDERLGLGLLLVSVCLCRARTARRRAGISGRSRRWPPSTRRSSIGAGVGRGPSDVDHDADEDLGRRSGCRPARTATRRPTAAAERRASGPTSA